VSARLDPIPSAIREPSPPIVQRAPWVERLPKPHQGWRCNHCQRWLFVDLRSRRHAGLANPRDV